MTLMDERMARNPETAQTYTEPPADTAPASRAPADQRLIEAGFPCHQVGAETQRERDTGKAPPTHRLHVWWARRPLTPSRAAILASLLPADADPEEFIKALGIRVFTADVRGVPWVLHEARIRERTQNSNVALSIRADAVVQRALGREQQIREENRKQIGGLLKAHPDLATDPTLLRWRDEVRPLPEVNEEEVLPVEVQMGDPAWANEKMEFAKNYGIRFPGDPYGYPRAFSMKTTPAAPYDAKVVLDPTAGGGSIPFEAFRLGHKVIANELNPVASVILRATLEFPAKFGISLAYDINVWGQKLLFLPRCTLH